MGRTQINLACRKLKGEAMRVANTMEIRLQNALNIIKEVECIPGITSMEIAQNRKLSLPTISNIVNILKNNHIVVSAGTGESSGGRKPLRLTLNPGFRYSIGVSIARHTVYVLLIDFEGQIYEKERHYIQFEDSDTYWQQIRDLIEKMQEKAPGECGVGLALPGFVDHKRGFAMDTVTLGKSSVALENIYRIVGEHISVDDSCKLAAMAQFFGKRDVKDYFFVLLSRRVGGILIYDQNIFSMKASSIDVGSMLIQPENHKASEGIFGSFYELCSASQIVEYVKENHMAAGYDDFFEKLEQGDASLAGIWDSYLRNLSIAVYNIYALFKADVVLGGEMAKYIAPYKGRLGAYVESLAPGSMAHFQLKCSIYGEYDDAYGAALESRSLFLRDQLPESLKNGAVSASKSSKG